MKKVLSLLLVLVVLCGMMPMTAFAAEPAKVTTQITLGDFAIAGVGTKALTASTTQLSQKTLIAVPYCEAELTITVQDGYQVCVYSGNHNNKINKNSGWLGADGDGKTMYTYTLPDTSIYMRVSIRKTDGSAMTQEDLALSGLAITYESASNVVEDNSDVVDILTNTGNPVLIHISDIHGDVIRAERATYFAEQVGADALLASGDLTAYEPDDWGSAVLDVFSKYNVNTLYGIGNHDVRGISAAESPELVYKAYYQDFTLTSGGKTYYYQDLTEQKLRIISVNQTEGAKSTSLGGTCFSQTQVDWLVETLTSTPEGYGVVLMYHSPEIDPTGSVDAEYAEFYQSENRVSSTMTGYSKYTGTLLADLVDAFMMKDTIQASYSEGDGSTPVTVNADFTKVAQGVEFIAHVTGHVHADTVTYLPGTFCKQLLLGVTCTTSMYGADGGYAKLADVSDLTREADSASQDAFNAYLIDRESKTVRVLRVGAREGDFTGTREDMSIPYSVPFEESKYPFDTEGLVKLDMSNVEWVNYGFRPYGTDPTYHPGKRMSTNTIFDVPYEGVTLYVRINAPYEMGIRSGASADAMDTNYYWVNNKNLSSGDKDQGYSYTLPAGHTKFILSIANVTRNASGKPTSSSNSISFQDLEFADVEIWYNPLELTITQQPEDAEAKLGERYMVEVKAEGEGLTYQWYYREADSDQWMLSSVTDSIYEGVMTKALVGCELYCVITDANGNSVTTQTVKLVCLTSWLPGDINGDGEVNNKDVTRLFQYLSDYEVEVVEAALDTNGDGEVNNKDLTRLFQYLSDYDVPIY